MTTPHSSNSQNRPRRGAVVVLASVLLVAMLGMVAFALDLGYIVLVRTQLQAAADSSAMAAAASMGLPRDEMVAFARQYAGYHDAGSAGRKVDLLDTEVEYGTWDAATRIFTPSDSPGNAVRVTTRTDEQTGGRAPLFFGRIFDQFSFSQRASAVAMANPRDIAFVVDLSGSMNDDAETCWATEVVNQTFASEGYPTVGSELAQKVYDDFGFGAFPGQLRYVGHSFSLAANERVYAELTKNNGPLSGSKVLSKYRIQTSDNEATRKVKAYSAIIDYEIAAVMPNAKPTPSSSQNYDYWARYLDYIMIPVTVRGSSSWGTPPNNRGTLPPNQSSDRIDGFNNPNRSGFPQATTNIPRQYRNYVGYRTYVQFMMDYGRDLKPDGGTYTPLSVHSSDCPWHEEWTPGGTFLFPPREQPTHASRRAMIAAIQVIRERNESISNPTQRDWVSIVTFDMLSGGGPVVAQSLTGDYTAAMQACTRIQAVGDKEASTATEAGLIAAREHIKPVNEGGRGRMTANKVVVLLTDGVPNLYVSDRSDINRFIAQNPGKDFYGSSSYAYNAPLMQTTQMQWNRWSAFPVGIGLGTDYDFMDRLARTGGTASDDGESPRGSGNPAEYEQRLTEIFEEIITNPKVRLVQ